MNLATHLNLVLRSRMHGSIPPLSKYAFVAWCSVKAQGQVYHLPLPLSWGGAELKSCVKLIAVSPRPV
jgi:hypothetical protein